MVNLITEKTLTTSTVSPYQTYTNVPAQKPQVNPSQVELPQDKVEIKKHKVKDILIPLGLITGGGFLLYKGLKKPSLGKMYRDYVDGKLFEMDTRVRIFTATVKNKLEGLVAAATHFIEDYKGKRFINPVDNIGPLRTLPDARHLIDAQDLAFESVAATANKAHFYVGASDFGNFTSTMYNTARPIRWEIEREKRIAKLELSDLVHTPEVKDGKYSDLIEAGENELINMRVFLSENIDRIVDEQVLETTKRLFRQMADAVLESRKRITQSKMNILDETYEGLRRILKLDDIRPNYHTISDASGFTELTEKQLKPTKLPAKLRKEAKSNVYLKALQSKDFSKLTEEDLKEIFYSAHYGNNLQDLRFLIDKLRVRQIVDKAKAPTELSTYDVIVPKLEYLSKRLNEFGKRELFGVLDKDFDTMPLEKKRASVYYVMRVAKRLGYDSIQEMDAVMLKENKAYADLSIRKFIPIFKDNPDLYFS